ncbi:hypothetical protein F2P81_007884 [Scophthalmus maximus]|uniref:Uncharacterized protein n=1 Tax=Scophthalmus maximus TaxID=52904 RepID=A0A6A4T430_SCOMX|nr:hypothetical protein F2P81_007884 [Scophthalmus maximus]
MMMMLLCCTHQCVSWHRKRKSKPERNQFIALRCLRAAFTEAYVTEIEAQRQIMLQGSGHPFSADMDIQDIHIDLTRSSPSCLHIPSNNSFDGMM